MKYHLKSLPSFLRKYPLVVETDLSELANMFAAIYEGAIVLGKLTKDHKILSRQILLYRNYIRFVFGDISRDHGAVNLN